MALPIWQRTITTEAGDVIPGAEVEVVNEATGLAADIFSNRAGTTPRTNPFFTGANGFAQFYVAPGEYRITATGPTGSITWRWNVLSGDAALRDVGTGASQVPTNGDLGSAAFVDTGTALGEVPTNSDLGTMSTQDANDVAITGGTISGIVQIEPRGTFAKADPNAVAWTKTGAGTATTGQDLYVEVGGLVLFIASGTSITMPSLSAGTDYAIWVNPDGTLQASTSFTTPPVAGGRKVGGFHYAPGGNASIDAAGNWNNHTGGNTTAQINEYSFYDLKWKPSAPDPRGLTLVNDSFWTGMYLMSANTTIAPLHKYNVNPARDGNTPQKPYGNGTTYGNARPMNIFECLAYYGFRAPNHNEFQLLAFGVNEQRSIGGSGPGNTGIVTDRGKNQQTSAWGVFDATGVLEVWGRDSLPDNTQDNNVTEGRSDNVWRISRFASFGGNWTLGAVSGSRSARTFGASASSTVIGGRGCCDHIIID